MSDIKIYKGRGTADMREDFLDFINLVFGFNGRDKDFLKFLPKLYKEEYAPCENNYVVTENGKLKAAIGVFPRAMQVLDETLSVHGVGNVAVHPNSRSKGYMKDLLYQAVQDMIDSGVVPFRASDLEDANNNLKKNSQSSYFRIDLGDYWSAQVYVLNDTDEGKPISQCYINEIYLPNKPEQTQDILKFDFPLNMTMEELVANAGEPEADNYRHYDGDNGYYSDTYKYTKPSTKYYASSYFSFEFTKGQLNYIYMQYMP